MEDGGFLVGVLLLLLFVLGFRGFGLNEQVALVAGAQGQVLAFLHYRLQEIFPFIVTLL